MSFSPQNHCYKWWLGDAVLHFRMVIGFRGLATATMYFVYLYFTSFFKRGQGTKAESSYVSI